MSIEETPPAAGMPPQTAYGRVIRERGTLRLVIAAIVLAVVWYVAGIVQTQVLLSHTYPPLKPDTAGLTVIGIQDKDRPGFAHKYEARESNHAWQIRYREDAAESDDEDQTPESKEIRPPSPAAGHATNQGATVSVEELLSTCPVVMTGKSFTSADIEEKQDPFLMRSYWVLHLGLNGEGQSRFWHFSRDHDKERMAFILQGEIIACPRMSHMNTSSLDIEPIWIRADAQRLADFINGKK